MTKSTEMTEMAASSSSSSSSPYILSFFFYLAIHMTIEFIYLSMSMPYYKKSLATIQNKRVDQLKPMNERFFPFGILAYIIFVACFWYFVLHDIVTGKERRKHVVFWRTTLLSLAIFGMYNLTNYVTLENYTVNYVIRDMLWGFLSMNFVAFVCLYVAVEVAVIEKKP